MTKADWSNQLSINGGVAVRTVGDAVAPVLGAGILRIAGEGDFKGNTGPETQNPAGLPAAEEGVINLVHAGHEGAAAATPWVQDQSRSSAPKGRDHLAFA